jgi:hypothetical protein
MAAGLNWGADSEMLFAIASKGVFLNILVPFEKLLQCTNHDTTGMCIPYKANEAMNWTLRPFCYCTE